MEFKMIEDSLRNPSSKLEYDRLLSDASLTVILDMSLETKKIRKIRKGVAVMFPSANIHSDIWNTGILYFYIHVYFGRTEPHFHIIYICLLIGSNYLL